jgi:plasmid stabilization system protein ParE
MPFGTPLNHCANILLWERAIIREQRDLIISGRGRLQDSRAIRIYFLLDAGAIHIIRVLHGKRDLSRLLDKKDP